LKYLSSPINRKSVNGSAAVDRDEGELCKTTIKTLVRLSYAEAFIATVPPTTSVALSL
jgi:hypothetical protein